MTPHELGQLYSEAVVEAFVQQVPDVILFGQMVEAKSADRIAALEAQLAASNERGAELAAALSMAEAVIKAAMASASVMNLSAAGGHLSAYIMCGRDYHAILAAVRERARRDAQIEALKALERQCELNAQNPLDGRLTVTRSEIRAEIAALEAKG